MTARIWTRRFLASSAHQLRPDVPIIMLTTNTDDEPARATLKRMVNWFSKHSISTIWSMRSKSRWRRKRTVRAFDKLHVDNGVGDDAVARGAASGVRARRSQMREHHDVRQFPKRGTTVTAAAWSF